MTPPTDPLEAALRTACEAVDVVVCIRGQPEMCACCQQRIAAESSATIPALAAAVREWIKGQVPGIMGKTQLDYDDEYHALADVAQRLGL